MLHGKQSYRYHALAHAGDTLTLTSRITKVVSGRAVEFLVKQTDITRDGALIAAASTTLVVRPLEAAA